MEPASMVTVNLPRKAGVRSEPATAATPLLRNATGLRQFAAAVAHGHE
jgi:hypothetical protein